MPEKERYVTCPYNASHFVRQSVMPIHLNKCRKANPTIELVACYYNATHMVPPIELQFHNEFCEDRFKLDDLVFSTSDASTARAPVPVEMPPPDEDWDNEPAPSTSYLKVIPQVFETKPVMRVPVGQSKAQRRAFQSAEAQRVQSLREKEAKETKSKPQTDRMEPLPRPRVDRDVAGSSSSFAPHAGPSSTEDDEFQVVHGRGRGRRMAAP